VRYAIPYKTPFSLSSSSESVLFVELYLITYNLSQSGVFLGLTLFITFLKSLILLVIKKSALLVIANSTKILSFSSLRLGLKLK
jgi:hypothetical protein